MYGYCPCKTQWILSEYALHLSLHLLSLLVYHIPAVLPFKRLDGNLLIIPGTLDQDIFLIEICHDAYPSVEISMLGRRIVLYEHDLSSDLEFKTRLRRI